MAKILPKPASKAARPAQAKAKVNAKAARNAQGEQAKAKAKAAPKAARKAALSKAKAQAEPKAAKAKAKAKEPERPSEVANAKSEAEAAYGRSNSYARDSPTFWSDSDLKDAGAAEVRERLQRMHSNFGRDIREAFRHRQIMTYGMMMFGSQAVLHVMSRCLSDTLRSTRSSMPNAPGSRRPR